MQPLIQPLPPPRPAATPQDARSRTPVPPVLRPAFRTSRRAAVSRRIGEVVLAMSLFASAWVPVALTAQTPARATDAVARISGVVRDTVGAPLANAQVLLVELHHVQTTDAAGRFVLRGLTAPGTYHLDVRLVGYAPQHVTVRVTAAGESGEVGVVLRPTILQLTSVHVTASPVGEADPMRITRSTV